MESPPSYHSHFCAFSYEGEIESLIKAFKFGNRPSLAKPLAKLFVEAWRDQQDYMLPGCIVAAPLYSRRLRYRGFNQSHLLATQIAAEMEVPYIKDAIEKIRPTESQSSLALRHRESNLKGAFKLKSSLKCNDVAIIDDVVTSGATMNEIANCLVNFGVDYVQAWGLAHTPKKT